jgi:hypothetical protein
MGSSCAAGPGTAVKLLWPEKIWRFRPIQANLVSETGTGRAPAGTTKSFPTALTPRSLDALERKKRQAKTAPSHLRQCALRRSRRVFRALRRRLPSTHRGETSTNNSLLGSAVFPERSSEPGGP